jgi:phosphatidate phosphatase APP1
MAGEGRGDAIRGGEERNRAADEPAGRGGLRRGLRRKVREFAELRRRIKRRFGWLAPLRISLYGGFGTEAAISVRGRVLEESPLAAPTAADRTLANLRRAFAQFESDEVAGVEIELTANGSQTRVVSDEDGYFHAHIELSERARPGWLSVEAKVTKAPYPTSELARAGGSALIPAPAARFGVISDIDDTILRTHVKNKPKMVFLTLLANALTRLSFDGTTDLYRGLQQAGDAPFFYISQSMWNIFPLLDHFIQHQGLPRGPLMLRDVSLLADRPAAPHKARAIEEVLSTYPELRFVLIGDSGERDLSLYLEAAQLHPGRVISILIRNVSGPKALPHLRAVADEATLAGCPTLIFAESSEAISHCRRLGVWTEPG